MSRSSIVITSDKYIWIHGYFNEGYSLLALKLQLFYFGGFEGKIYLENIRDIVMNVFFSLHILLLDTILLQSW